MTNNEKTKPIFRCILRWFSYWFLIPLCFLYCLEYTFTGFVGALIGSAIAFSLIMAKVILNEN